MLAVDTLPPITIAPPDVDLEAPADISPASTGFATVTDDTDPSPTVSFSDIKIPTACVHQFTILRIWTGMDASENISTDLQVIRVSDTLMPELIVPMDVTLAFGEPTDPSNTGVAIALDAADPDPLVSFADEIVAGDSPESFTIVRTWTATDDCGNTRHGEQRIIVSPQDTTPPEITINLAVDGNDMPISEGDSTFSDAARFEFSSNEEVTFEANLDGAGFVVVSSPLEIHNLEAGDHRLEVRAIDEAGNISSPAVLHWTVQTPITAIEDVIDKVTELDLPKGTQQGLLAKLDTSLRKLSDGNPNNDTAAINNLHAFLRKLDAARGKQLSDSQADALSATVTEIIEELK